MLNMKNTILSANVLHNERNLLIATLVLTAISCFLNVAHVVNKLVDKWKDRKAKREQERKAQAELLKSLTQIVEAIEARLQQGSQPTVPIVPQTASHNYR